MFCFCYERTHYRRFNIALGVTKRSKRVHSEMTLNFLRNKRLLQVTVNSLARNAMAVNVKPFRLGRRSAPPFAGFRLLLLVLVLVDHAVLLQVRLNVRSDFHSVDDFSRQRGRLACLLHNR